MAAACGRTVAREFLREKVVEQARLTSRGAWKMLET
jgi:hypothetical protein